MINLRSNSERARSGNIFDTNNIRCNTVEIGHIYDLPNVQLSDDEFLAFYVNKNESNAVSPQFYVPILENRSFKKFNKSFYSCMISNHNLGYRLGTSSYISDILVINNLELVKVKISNHRFKSILNHVPVEGKWDVSFRFYNETPSDDELLFVQHGRDNLVNHSKIGIRLLYTSDDTSDIRHFYSTDKFHYDKESVLSNYQSSYVKFRITDKYVNFAELSDNSSIFLLVLLRRY